MGNRFTLIDAAGEEIPVSTYDPKTGPYIDCVVIDALERTSKIFYDKPFDPGASQYEPPACFSDNGVAPSRNAAKPQSPTCASCPQAAWGSKVSAVSGKGVKACADIQKIAILVPGYEMPFLLRVPPNSRANFRGYVNKFVGQPADISDVTTRITFEPGGIGTLHFDAVGWLDEQTTLPLRDKLIAAHSTDSMIGRTDMPIQGAIAAPAATPAIEHQQPFVPVALHTAPGATTVAPMQPASQQPTGRRRRNTAEATPSVSPASSGQGQPQQAPFMSQPASQQSNGPTPNFGMAQAPAPNAEITATLEGLFGKK